MPDEFSQAVVADAPTTNTAAAPASTDQSQQPARSAQVPTGNEFDHASNLPANEFAAATATADTGDPFVEGFVQRMWANDYGKTLLATPGQADRMAAFAAQNPQPEQTGIDPVTHDYAQPNAVDHPVEQPGAIAQALGAVNTQAPGQQVTDIGAGQYAKSTVQPEVAATKDRYYRQLYQYLVQHGRDPFKTTITPDDQKALGLDPLTGEPVTVAQGFKGAVSKGVESLLAAPAKTEAFVADALQSGVDYFQDGPRNGGQEFSSGTAGGNFAANLRSGQAAFEQVNPESQNAATNPYSIEGLGEHITQTATSIAAQLAATGGLSAVGAPARTAAQIAFFGQMAGQTADDASQTAFKALTDQGMDPVTAKREALVVGAGSAAAQTFLQARVGALGKVLGTAETQAINKTMNTFVSSIGAQLVAGRGSDAIDQLSQYAATGKDPDVERFLAGGVGDAVIGGIFAAGHVKAEMDADQAQKEFVATHVAKSIFESMGVPAEKIQAAAEEVVGKATGGDFKTGTFNDVAAKYGAQVELGEPAAEGPKVKQVVNTAESAVPANAAPAPAAADVDQQPAGSGKVEKGADLPDSSQPGVTRITRPAGGWGSEEAKTITPTEGEQSDHVEALKEQADQLRATLKTSTDLSAQEKAVTQGQLDDLDTMLKKSQELIGTGGKGNNQVIRDYPPKLPAASEESPPSAPAAPTAQDAAARGEAEAKRLGIKFLGVDDPGAGDEDLKGVPPALMFQDEKSGNFNIPLDGDVESALAKKRAAFTKRSAKNGPTQTDKTVSAAEGVREGETQKVPQEEAGLKVARDVKYKEQLSAAVARMPEGTLLHGTDLSHLAAIAEEGVQPGKLYVEGGSSDEGHVYGSRVRGGEAGGALPATIGRYKTQPVLLEMGPNVVAGDAGGSHLSLHSLDKVGNRSSYIKPADVAAVHIPGQAPMSLADAVTFAKGETSQVKPPDQVKPRMRDMKIGDVIHDRLGDNYRIMGRGGKSTVRLVHLETGEEVKVHQDIAGFTPGRHEKSENELAERAENPPDRLFPSTGKSGTLTPTPKGEDDGSTEPGQTPGDDRAALPEGPGGGGDTPGGGELGATGDEDVGDEQSGTPEPAGPGGRAGEGGDSGTGAGGGPLLQPDAVGNEPARGAEPGGEGGYPGIRPGSVGAVRQEPSNTGNFRMNNPAWTRPVGGEVTRTRNNVSAIRLTKEILAQDRPATADEQAIIAKYTGWGGVSDIFTTYPSSPGMEAMKRELISILSEDEYDSARRSIQNAHFTDGDIVQAMWEGLKAMGFDGGRVLEPSMGMGYFFSLMPEMSKESALVGVEMEALTGQMSTLLHPDAKVHINAYQRVSLPANYFDVAVGNVPFGDTRIREDAAYGKMAPLIHDYFFLKALDHVRPGGIVAFVTSKGTMDSTNSEAARRAMAGKADLLLAVRLPTSAHKAQAGTDVVTDILVLRKRGTGADANLGVSGPSWSEVKDWDVGKGLQPFPVNEYFHANPTHVLGTIDASGKMYRGSSMGVTPAADWKERLTALMRGLPKSYLPRQVGPRAFEPQRVADPGQTKEQGLLVREGKLYRKEGAELVEQKAGQDTIQRVEGMLRVRDALRELFQKELAGQDPAAARAKLNEVYDQFKGEHGSLRDKKNLRAIGKDPDAAVLYALEDEDAKGKTTKANVFSQSTLRPNLRQEKVEGVERALAAVLNESATVDVPRMAELTGKSPDAIEKELVDKELAFQDPGSGWTPGDVYLSGNVKKKLAEAQAAAAIDPKYAPNAQALAKVQPPDVAPTDIDARMGAAWVPESDHEQFIRDTLGNKPGELRLYRNPEMGGWVVVANGYAQAFTGPSAQQFITGRANLRQTLSSALNNTPHVVYDEIEKGKKVVNRQETDKANIAVQNLRDAFKDWIWKDDDRRERLAAHYNATFNTHRNIAYNGSHLTFPGMNPMIEMRKWQSDGVWMQLMRQRGLMAHEVGTGKTFMEVASAMEMKRLGMANKPTIAVPKDLIDQVTRDAQTLYPAARILSTSGKFEAEDRQRTVSSIATGDWDLVVMTHEHMNYLTQRPEAIEEFIKGEQDEIENVIQGMQSQPGLDKKIIKQMERAKDKVEQRWLGLLSRAKKDNAVFFEETGIDHLFVDEGHAYKALPVYTQHRNVKGIPNGSSDRAKLLFMKARYLYGIRGGKGLTMLTGTPITNTMAELYNFQKYLQYEELKQLGIHAFDAWASTFGQITTKMEFTHAGTVKDVAAFSSFINLPELRKIVGSDMDVVRSPAELKRPKMEIKPIDVNETETQRLYRLLTLLRVTRVPGRPGPGDDMHLLITGDGAKAAIDPRLVLPDAPDEPGSKLNRLVDNVLKLHKERPDRLQFIFSDTGVWPTSWGFSAYSDIVDKLVAGGIPRERIVDARQFSGSKAKRLRAMASMQANRGEISIFLGSTKKIGTGLNAQRYAVALHHLDAPYLPGDIEQRNGRGYRQGNLLYEEGKPLQVFPYVTLKSADAFRWQLVTRKSKFINDFQDGSLKARSVEDQDISQLSPDQIMALASGNPKLMEKIQADQDVKTMEAQRRFHQEAQYSHKHRIRQLEKDIPQQEKEIAETNANYERLKAMTEGKLDMVIGKKSYTDPESAGIALQNILKGYDESGTLRDAPGYRREIAEWGDIKIYAEWDIRSRTTSLHIMQFPNGWAKFQNGYATRTVDPKNQVSAITTAILRGAKPDHWAESSLASARQALARGKAESEKPYSREKEFEATKKRANDLATELRGVETAKTADDVLKGLKPWERDTLERWYAERMGRIGNNADALDFGAESGDEDELPDETEGTDTPTEMSPLEKRDAIIDKNITHKGEGPPGAVQAHTIKPNTPPPAGGKVAVGLTLAVEGAIESAAKAKDFFTNTIRNMRERFARYEQDYGTAAKPLEDSLIGYITARETGKSMGNDLAGRTLEGLTEEEGDNLISYKLDGYRRAQNMLFAVKMAKQITPADMDPDDIAAVVADAFNTWDSIDPAGMATELSTRLGAIDPELVDNWTRLMASDIDYTPEAMSEREQRNAMDYFKAPDDLRTQWEADPKIAGANDWWETNVAPWIDDIRVRRQLPMNPYFKTFDAINFVTDTFDDLFPRELAPGVSKFNRFTYKAERKRFIGPAKEYLSKVIAGHYRTDKETDLYNTLDQVGVSEKNTDVNAEGERKGEFLGKKDVTLYPFDVEPSNRKKDIKFFPADLADPNPTSPGDLFQIESPGEMKHRAIADAARNFLLGLHLAGNMVGVAYRAAGSARRAMYSERPSATAVVTRMFKDVAMTPYLAARNALGKLNAPESDHEAMQETLEALGAASHRVADATSLIGRIWTYGDKILYDRVWGAENVIRRYVMENHLRSRFGDAFVDRILAGVKSGSLTPPEAARVFLGQLGADGRVDVMRSVNNLLGWLDKDTRSPWMNKVRVILPYVGTHVSTIPSEIASLMSGNVNWSGVYRAAAAGNWKHAAKMIAAGILAGALGSYLLMNLINYAVNGHGMQDNDEGHHLDIQFGKWYFGLDSGLQRAARLMGFTEAANGSPNITQETATKWWNTFWSSADPGFELLSNMLLGKSMQVDPDASPYAVSRSRGIPTPYVQATAQAVMEGKPTGPAILKDLNTNLLGAPLQHDDRTGDQQRAAAYELAVQRAAAIMQRPASEQRNEQLSNYLSGVGNTPIDGGLPLDAKNVYRDASLDSKRPLINSLVKAVRADDTDGISSAMSKIGQLGVPVAHLERYLVDRKFLSPEEVQRIAPSHPIKE